MNYVLKLKQRGGILKYYDEIAKLQCFSRDELAKITNDKKLASNIITEYQKKGLIKQVKRNLYATVSLENGGIIPSRYKFASKITENSYITHHSALEFHGVANQVYYTCYVSGKNRFNDFEFDGVNYKYIYPRGNFGIVKQNGINITDIEKTVLDSINDLEKIAGLEEILKCIQLIPSLDENKLLEYLKLYNKIFLYQKTGYVLSSFSDMFTLSDNFFRECHKNIGKSKRYLTKDSNVYNNKWQIFVPNQGVI